METTHTPTAPAAIPEIWSIRDIAGFYAAFARRIASSKTPPSHDPSAATSSAGPPAMLSRTPLAPTTESRACSSTTRPMRKSSAFRGPRRCATREHAHDRTPKVDSRLQRRTHLVLPEQDSRQGQSPEADSRWQDLRRSDEASRGDCRRGRDWCVTQNRPRGNLGDSLCPMGTPPRQRH